METKQRYISKPALFLKVPKIEDSVFDFGNHKDRPHLDDGYQNLLENLYAEEKAFMLHFTTHYGRAKKTLILTIHLSSMHSS